MKPFVECDIYIDFRVLQTCQSCFKTIPKGDVVVLAEFEDNDEAFYHSACFCCSTCFELLVDLTYFKYGNRIYCGRHHAELSRQRCFGCDEVSFSIVEETRSNLQKQSQKLRSFSPLNLNPLAHQIAVLS